MIQKSTNLIKRGIAAAVFAATMAAPVATHAVPAYPGVIRSEQPDGTTLGVVLKGDERGHRLYTTDGYLLLHDAEGYLTYAMADTEGLPIASGCRATDPDLRGAGEKQFLATLRQPMVTMAFDKSERLLAAAREAGESPRLLCSGAAFPAKDSPRALVVLVEYDDVSFQMENPQDFYQRMLNEEEFSDYNATGSARDFFIENSHGLFSPQFDVCGPVKLKYARSHYGANDYYGNDVAPEEMVIEACQALDETVDFSVYDTNDDGQIDNVFLFYAGYGEADSTIANTIWPHSADIKDFNLGEDYYFDGKLLNRYGCTCEIDFSYRRPDGIGTFVHEFSHVMGLPDLYATTYSNAFTPGEYNTLDMGPYNNNGRTPPHYSVFERYCLDWLEPELIEKDGVYTLEAIHKSNKGYMIPTESENEFFLLENRQQECCDAFIPGHGMIVWHVDYVPRIWNGNIVNNTPSHQYVDLVEADNRRSESTRAGDPFPGSQNVTEYHNLTTPSLMSWSGDRLMVGIHEISENDGVISFRVDIDTSGVNDVVADGGDIYADGDTLVNATDSAAVVYDMAGYKVAEVAAGSQTQLPAGLYIVAAGDSRLKLRIR